MTSGATTEIAYTIWAMAPDVQLSLRCRGMAKIRTVVTNKFDSDVEAIRVQHGGSVNAANSSSFLSTV